MQRIHVKFEESDLAILDQQAKSAQVSRSELIRNRLLTAANGKSYTPRQYQDLVSAAYKRTNLPRQQVQQLVDFVFVELMAPRVEGAIPD
jgi:metal-responsive CopG/Arc/MetJ family transcriptional regulator